MKQKTFITVASWIFLVIAIVHATRIILGWTVIVNGVALPLWFSWIVVLVIGYLAYQAHRLNK